MSVTSFDIKKACFASSLEDVDELTLTNRVSEAVPALGKLNDLIHMLPNRCMACLLPPHRWPRCPANPPCALRHAMGMM